MPARRPLLWLSTDAWSEVWTRKQRFARMFAARGHPVLYVEGPQHWLSVLLRLPRSLGRLRRSLAPPREVEPGLFVLTLPPLLPFFQRWDAVNRLNARLVRPFLARALARLGFERPLAWVYPPYAAPFVEGLGATSIVYDCVDEWSSFSGLLDPATVRRQEEQLLRRADLVVVTTETLAASKGPLAKRLALVPNAADAEHFRRALDPATPLPADVAAIPGPRIGFVGGVQYWIDLELLEEVARSRPDLSLVLVGPVGRLARTEGLRALANVHFLGLKPYAALPGYLKAFDVCLVPFKRDETGRNVSPLKLFEYLAAGREVVSVDLPAVRGFAGLVRIAATPAEFVAAIGAALASSGDRERLQARLAEAERHTWEARFAALVAALGEALA